MRTIVVYQCSYCKKFYKKTERSVIKHERTCFFNPCNHACATCYYKKIKTRSYQEADGTIETKKTYYCYKQKKYLVTWVSPNSQDSSEMKLQNNCEDWLSKI